uniref:Uncharacterized protein n=1 Tax=Arundo donax TaxID=35708 RepID=A0A0A9DLU5_ARUDO
MTNRLCFVQTPPEHRQMPARRSAANAAPPHAPTGRRRGRTLLLDPEPAAELRRVDDARDAGPARHEQPRHLRVPPARLGRGDGERLGLLPARRRLESLLAEERSAPQELVRQVPGQELVAPADALAGGPRRRRRELRLSPEPSSGAIRLAARVGPSERGRPRERHRRLLRRGQGGVVVLPLLPLPKEGPATWRLHRCT